MTLSGQELKKISEALEGVILQLSELDLIVRRALEQSLDNIAPNLPLKLAITISLTFADRSQKVKKFLIGVQSVCDAKNVIEPLMLNLYAQEEVVASQQTDHFQTCFPKFTCMVDRAELRHELKRLACDAEAPRILKVTGDQGTGKSFSLELISHLCEKLPPEQRAEFVLLDYSRHRDPVEAVDIANTIATRMKMLNVLPVRSDQPQASKWAALFIDAWVAEVRTSPSSWWVVIDGLNSATLTQDAQDLIGELALQVHYCLPSVRLVLLGYRGNLFPQTHISEERIKPIVLEDLEAFIAKALSERQIEKDPKDMAQSASEVWEQIKQNDTYLLHKLPECLKAVLK